MEEFTTNFVCSSLHKTYEETVYCRKLAVYSNRTQLFLKSKW